MDGTLNCYSAQTEDLQIDVHGNTATITEKSKVTAAVFGGGKHIDWFSRFNTDR